MRSVSAELGRTLSPPLYCPLTNQSRMTESMKKRKWKREVGMVSAWGLALLLMSSCGFEGETFFLREQAGPMSKRVEVYSQGRRCIQKTEERTGAIHTVSREEVSKDLCLPFLIGRRLVSQFGECKVVNEVRSGDLFTETRFVISRQCLCYHEHLESIGAIQNVEKKWAELSECLEYLPEEKARYVEEILDELE